MARPAPFGRKGCVTPQAVAAIADATLLAEAILLAVEAGHAGEDLCAVTGLGPAEITAALDAKRRPFVRDEI